MKKTSMLTAALLIATLPTLAADKFDFGKLDLSKLPPPSDKSGLNYTNDIRPLLESSCFRCHGEQRPRGGLRLDNLEAVLKGGTDGKVVVVGDSQKSPLVVAVAQIDDETAMPPKKGPGRGGPPGGPGGFGGPGGPGGPPGGVDGGRPPGPGENGGPRGKGPGGGFGPPPKPLSAEQVGLIRSWIDQGAK